MKGTFKLICAAVAAIIMIAPLAAFGEEIQIDTMSHTNADGAIGCGGGGQGSVKITDGDSDKDGQPTSGESGGSSGGSGAGIGYRAYSIKQAVEYFNVQDYTIEDSEKQDMHGYDTALRRDRAIGEAWIVFEIPYIRELDARSLHLPGDVAPMKFEFSKDGKVWTAAEVNVAENSYDDRWTELIYSAEQISGVRYVKAIWGEEKNLQNWWNPYFIELSATFAEPFDYEIVIDTDESIAIPRYDSREYILSGRVLDQIGLERDSEILWSSVPDSSDDSDDSDDSENSESSGETGGLDDSQGTENPDVVTVNSDGTFTVSADMQPGTKFTVRAQCGELTAEKTFTLCAALPGDTDGDNIITQADIDFILENYGKAANAENRLCDVDKDGKIDIVDLCYAARYVNVDFNKRPSDDEKDPDNAEDKSEDSDDSNKSGSGDLSGSADGDADSANARR